MEYISSHDYNTYFFFILFYYKIFQFIYYKLKYKSYWTVLIRLPLAYKAKTLPIELQ